MAIGVGLGIAALLALCMLFALVKKRGLSKQFVFLWWKLTHPTLSNNRRLFLFKVVRIIKTYRIEEGY